MAKAKPLPAPIETQVYPVIDSLRHDGHDYTPGDTVELDAATAAILAAAGVVGTTALLLPAEK